jgi:phosphoglycolate phosphatase
MSTRLAPNPLEAVLFDLDGTLIDSKMDIAAAANSARIHFGLVPLPLDIVVTYIGRGVDHLLHCTLGEHSTPERIQEGMGILMAYYHDHLVVHTTVYPGVRGFLDSLKARGSKMGVVSNKPHALTPLTLEKTGLKPYFPVALGADATPNKKPHPEPLLTALKELGARPSHSIMVGDSVVDAQAGRAAGMSVALVSHGYTHRSELVTANADWLVDSMEELMGILK